MLISHRVNRERIVVLGWGRAILMQLAHPLVAAGVAEHSGFAQSRWTRLQRLHATVGAMVELSFEERRDRTAARINAIHDRVNGRLAQTVGRYAAGTPYSATDGELLAWVHTTLLDSVPTTFERFVAPLTRADKDRYCQESLEVARLLRIPDSLLPRSADCVAAAVAEGVSSGFLAVGPQARELARQLLHPPLTDPSRPAAWLVRLVTIGLLPPAIRDAYGFAWSGGRERSLALVSGAIRRLVRLLPPPVRYWWVK